MRPKLLSSLVFLFFFAANSLPAELLARNFSFDIDGSDDELCAIYYATVDDDPDDMRINRTEFFSDACGAPEIVFQLLPSLRFTEAEQKEIFIAEINNGIPLYIRKRSLLI